MTPVSGIASGLSSSMANSTVSGMTSEADKVRENRLRRAAERQGLQLVKSRRRDPRAMDYGTYMLTDPATNTVVVGTAATGRSEWTLDDVEDYLTGGPGAQSVHAQAESADDSTEVKGKK